MLVEKDGHVLCEPCAELGDDGRTRHEDCQRTPWCECWTEVLIEAEEQP